MKKFLIILIVVIILIVGIMFGMSNKKAEEKNILVVGLDDNYPPMGFRNENNEIVGFDIDLAKAVCEKLDMELKLQQISWAAKEQELDSGKIDCIWSGFAYNEERAKTMTLTTPYIKGEMYFILKDGSEAKKQDDLKGKKIGVQSGSIQQLDLEASEFGKEVEIIPFADYLTAFMDLEKGGIDAVFCSNIIGNYLLISKGKNYNTIPSIDICKTNGSVIAFKQGNTALRDEIQNALYELKKEGKLEEISEKWFGKNMILLEEE